MKKSAYKFKPYTNLAPLHLEVVSTEVIPDEGGDRLFPAFKVKPKTVGHLLSHDVNEDGLHSFTVMFKGAPASTEIDIGQWRWTPKARATLKRLASDLKAVG